MYRVRKIAGVLYVLAAVVIVGGGAASLAGPYRARMAELAAQPWCRLLIAACLAVVAVQALIVLGRVIFVRREPACVHPDGNPAIEVSLAALTSLARVAAEAEPAIMVEDVRARVVGRAEERVRIAIDAIAFTDTGLEGLAARVQRQVTEACERMLGASGVQVRVRFLPSRTVTVSKEVSGE